ncbi:MAG: hypothetical protein ABIG71_03265 [Candidatus Uhrbacteria bacterium]
MLWREQISFFAIAAGSTLAAIIVVALAAVIIYTFGSIAIVVGVPVLAVLYAVRLRRMHARDDTDAHEQQHHPDPRTPLP